MSKNNTGFRLSLVAAAACAAFAPAAGAAVYNMGEVTLSIDNKLSAGIAVRTRDPDPRLLGIANGGDAFSTNYDDANKVWDDKGEIVSSPIKLLTDMRMTYREVGFLLRGSFGYNPVLDNKDFFERSNYADDGSREATTAELREKEEDVRRAVGRYAEVLDAYAFGAHELLGRSFGWRVGRQVINWGESTLVQNGLNSLLAANANRARTSGFEIEEVIIPWGAAWASWDIIDNVSIEGFYQFEWEKSIPDAAGTMFSTNDFVSDGGTRANIGFGRVTENSPPFTPCAPPVPTGGNQCVPFGSSVPRAPDNEPEDGDQYGGAVHFFVPWLNNSDIGLFAAKYHSRLPLISGISRITQLDPAANARYQVDYPEDIQMYGGSFSASLPFGLAAQGEFSYKVDQPLQLDDVELLLAGLGARNQITGNFPVPVSLGGQYIRGWRRHDVSQIDVSFTKIYGPINGLYNDQLTLIAEFALTEVHGLPHSSELRYEAPGTPLPGDAVTARAAGLCEPAPSTNCLVDPGQYATATSWGYKLLGRISYNNVFNLVNTDYTLRIDHDVEGITPAPLNNFVESRKLMQFTMGVDYLSTWRGEVGWTRYFGADGQNLLHDRDFVELSLKYAF